MTRQDSIGRRGFLAAAGALTLAPFSIAAAAVPDDGPDVIMIIRHAEKPTGSHGPRGVLLDGRPDSKSLTPTGWARAGALVELFDPRTVDGAAPLRVGLTRPAHLYAADPEHGSRRPQETLEPLSARMRLHLDTRLRKGDEVAAGRHLAQLTGATLVAWEHKHIPPLARALGPISGIVPAKWPSHRFDVVWCFTRGSSGAAWHFSQIPELLLAGDSARPIR